MFLVSAAAAQRSQSRLQRLTELIRMICSGILYSWGQIQRIPTLSPGAGAMHIASTGFPGHLNGHGFYPLLAGFQDRETSRGAGYGRFSSFKARTANATRLKSCELPAHNEEKRPDFRTKEARILLRKDWLQGAIGALLIRLGAQSAPDLSPAGPCVGAGLRQCGG